MIRVAIAFVGRVCINCLSPQPEKVYIHLLLTHQYVNHFATPIYPSSTVGTLKMSAQTERHAHLLSSRYGFSNRES